jgi:tol-pal system protein YbgF
LSGCATKGDLRDVHDEIQALAAQQREIFQELTGVTTAVQDTLGSQSDALFETRGETNRRLQLLEQEILTIQELLRMNQQSLVTIRDLLSSQRSSAGPLMRTDTEPGQMSEVEFGPGGDPAGGARQAFDAARTQFDRGSFTTARRAFQDFLRSYSDHALAPEAHYYLAMILVEEDRLEEAIQAFLAIPENFPAAEKVPEALYQVGVAYIALGDTENARLYLRRVVNSYGETQVAVQAQERLDEIG